MCCSLTITLPKLTKLTLELKILGQMTNMKRAKERKLFCKSQFGVEGT